MTKKIKVLIVDDSAVVRKVLTDVLKSDPGIEVMETASDPFVAAKKMMSETPDVITLDVEMPRMDGITFLKKIMSQHPIPVVMVSSLTDKGCETALKALEYGAVDIITKPKMGVAQFLADSKVVICDAVKAAGHARMQPHTKTRLKVAKKLTADVVLAKASSKAMIQTTEKIAVIGASTGGTEALRVFLEGFPQDAPGMVIVQHMPENFTTAFSKRLDSTCRISVKEAADNDTVMRGRALLAPGNRHTLLKRSGARYHVEVKKGPLVSRHRPSVDVLFRSAARYGGPNVVGAIMTGMGDDGAKGMLEMKEAGSTMTIAQNEETCVVFGMPREAIKLGGVSKVMALEDIAGAILRECRL